jgi:transcriptional regulator with PAS, ATPase and Fis domain
MRQMVDKAEKAGRSRWPVLVLGETGTGKEVVARAVHSVKNEGPFITIDCSAMVGPLMESELFGHIKGSFTGAAATKIGLIESANGGTAFFDEIGELPLDLQAKLLRVLQEKEFRPVGSLTQKRSDFRVIAATNRDLTSEVEKGTFRRDLFYRLNVVHLRLIPLRERKEDIPLLIEYFLGRCGSGYCVTQEALDALISYNWPGNVRELEHCLQHMVALNSGPLLHAGGLPSPVQNHLRMQRAQCLSMAVGVTSGGPGTPSTSVGFDEADLPMPIPMAEMERQAIARALKYTKGDRAVAAHMLGIGRTTLYRKIKEYRLEPEIRSRLSDLGN